MDNNNHLNEERWTNAHLAPLRPDEEWQPDLSRGLARLRERRSAGRGQTRKWGWVVGTLAMGLPLMALPVTRALAERCVSACVEESGWMRSLLRGNSAGPVAGSNFVGAADRRLAPDFTMTDASGKPVKLSEYRGKAVLLNFWATWCGPCEKEIPMLKGLQQEYQDRGFTVLGVSLDDEGWNAVRPYMKTAQFNYPVMVGGEDVEQRYGGMAAVPTTLVIDRSGRIAALHVGLCNRSEYETDIDAVLKER